MEASPLPGCAGPHRPPRFRQKKGYARGAPRLLISPRLSTFQMPRDNSIHKILLIGSGPIVIGQGCEFDYSGVQACKALREEGYKVVLVNSNPATIMTDPEFADRTYIEPITPECVEKIIVRELAEMKKMGVPVDSPVTASRKNAADSSKDQPR